MNPRRPWLHMEPLLAVLLWGGVYPGAKLGLQEIPVVRFTALRILVALLVLWGVSWRERTWRLPRVLWPTLLAAGLAQMAFQVLLIAGLHWTTAGNSAILLATAPLLTAGWLALRGRSRLSQRQWLGLALGLGGVGVVLHGSGLAFTWSQLHGDVLSLGAAVAWTWYSLAIGPLVGALGPVRATGWTMLVAAGGFVPLAVGEMQTHAWLQVSWRAWAGLLYGATVGMVPAMTLWGKAVQRFGAQPTMLYVYLEPVAAVVLAAVVLGEAVAPLQVVGALLTLVGVGLASVES